MNKEKMNTPDNIGTYFKFVSNDTGDTIEAIPEYISPLDYNSLIKAITGEAFSVSMQLSEKSKFNGNPLEGYTATLKSCFNKKTETVALSNDGWLPLIGIPRKSIILADSNMIGDMDAINRGIDNDKLSNNKLSNNKWWIDRLLNKEVTINPVLYAMEKYFGLAESKSSIHNFRAFFKEARRYIRQYSHLLEVVRYRDKQYQIVYSEIESYKDQIEREIDFLITSSPLVHENVSKKNKAQTRDDILDKARNLDILGKSLCPLLPMACLYETKASYKAARKVLKPKSIYTEKMARNTCMDMHFLRLFIYSLESPGKNIYFCTGDYGLAAFWAALLPIQYSSGKCTFSITEHLFPGLTEEERIKLGNEVFSS